MTTLEANSIEGLQLQLALVKQNLTDEIIWLDILHNGANTRQYEKIESYSDAEIIIVSKKLMENNIEVGKLETILHYYFLLIDQKRRVKEVADALAM